ncbi:hypothetical protein [Tardiphaga robiniae]|uniref:MFS transporter n=1 Tax=Tardiphaga robiniae TaxID=943830 RepID=A0A161QL68_9BRAD|nr:hypothetical protein [Tardiphaga robiniae]KZD20714.1 hypothetical protein A4A58_18480 [Tardiphaga robiniae]
MLGPIHATAHSRSFFSNRTTIVGVSVSLNVAGFTIILPVIPFLVGRYVQLELVGLYVSLIVSVFALCLFCAAPVLVLISDHHGRRPVFILMPRSIRAGIWTIVGCSTLAQRASSVCDIFG